MQTKTKKIDNKNNINNIINGTYITRDGFRAHGLQWYYIARCTQYTGLHVHKTIISQHGGGDWRISVGQNHFYCKRERRRVTEFSEFFRDTTGF